MKTNKLLTVMLTKNHHDNTWWLSTYRGGDIPAIDFTTAKNAMEYARAKKWAVKRLPECDYK